MTVIHELRTPMTSISGYTELLQDEAGGSLTSTQDGFVNAISRNSDRLTALANDLLTLSSLEPGTIGQDQTEVDLVEIVSSAHSALQAVLDARDLTVTFKSPAAPVFVNGDARQLERMVSNLVTNAVKFTDDGGWVRCALTEEGDDARITVSDNGIGIPVAEQGDLFTRFFRSSSALAHEVPGSGLELTIMQSIAEGHGGTIKVVSEHMHGSTFTVDLPQRHRADLANLPRPRSKMTQPRIDTDA